MNVNSMYYTVFDYLNSCSTVDQCTSVEDCIQALHSAYSFRAGGNHRERSSMLSDYISKLIEKKRHLEAQQ